MDTRLTRAKTGLGPRAVKMADRSPWDWYAQSCPCGLPSGECRAHPRARTSQRPPPGDWRVWAYVAGRGPGKTRADACWIQHRAEGGVMKLGCLIAPTTADIRDVMVEGQSGLLAVAPHWCRPRGAARSGRGGSIVLGPAAERKDGNAARVVQTLQCLSLLPCSGGSPAPWRPRNRLRIRSADGGGPALRACSGQHFGR
jgi:hypothetical protein